MRFSTSNLLLLSEEAVRDRALGLLAGMKTEGKTPEWKEEEFRAHFGSPSKVCADQWNELCVTDIEEAKLKAAEMSKAGFKRFMMAHFFLWQKPKNARTFGSRFGVCERLARGYPVWKWVDKIAALSKKVIFWTSDLDAVNTAVRILSVDGVDFRTWERSDHPKFNIDTEDCSHKHNHAAAKYEIALHVFKPQCVWIQGPFRGGKHDLDIFREGKNGQSLKGKVKPWKKVIADRGYRSKEVDEQKMFSIPSNTDSKENKDFKNRVRLRHETFNGRLKNFNILDQTFQYKRDRHLSCVLAVACIVQYQMNNGAPIFDV